MSTEADPLAMGPLTQTARQRMPDKGGDKGQLFVASQWLLMWWKFRRHRLALVATGIVVFLYLLAGLAGFAAPFDPTLHNAKRTNAPPQALHLLDRTADGLQIGLYVHDYDVSVDPIALRRVFTVNEQAKIPIGFFVRSQPYRFIGLFDTDIHLFGPKDGETQFYLLGADRMGRDVLSRIIHGGRISLSIGLIGVFVSLFLGIIIGGFSGYIGGRVDNLIQRFIEFLISMPTIPLWMGLSAALPQDWSPLMIYLAITVILSLRGWTGMARVVRGRFLSLRSEDFILAARLNGASESRIIFRHMVPSFLSHIIASVTLSIPGMILSETSLSFLGLGIRAPLVSWGVLLQDAQHVRSVVQTPWLLLPGLAVVVAVLALNFVGDGLRDAADPYVR